MTCPKIQKIQNRSKLAPKKKSKRAGGQYLCTCGSNAELKFQSKIIKIGRDIAVMPLLPLLLDLSIEFWSYLLMNGELGSDTYIHVPLVPLALSPPIFTLIGNTDIYTNSLWKSWCFWAFADASARSSRKQRTFRFFHIVFVRMCSVASRLALPIFKS